MHARAVAAVAVLLALAAPAALAGWSGKGSFEPSTALDRAGAFMWSDPETSPGLRGSRVYFNAFQVQNTGYGLHGLTTNPNSGTLQTSRSDWPGQVAALLGVWKDCNKDGFVGWGDNGLFEYRAELLALPNANGVVVGAAVCPVGAPGTPPAGAASHGWVGVHNDGVWVRELMPLGPDQRADSLADANPWDLNDNAARVWADWGLPGAAPPGSRCFVVFVPDGTYHSTGGLVNYVDCMDGFFVTDTLTAAGDAGADGTPLGQLSFKDAPRDQGESRSALNRPNPWGSPEDAAYASAFDCGSGQLAHQTVPGTTYEVGVSQPRAPAADAGGSPSGTVNETLTAMDDCDRSDNDGEWESQATEGAYSLEDEGVRNVAGDRVISDFPMSYTEGTRPALPLGPVPRSTATDGGTRAYDAEGLWLSGPRIAEDRNPYVDRADLRGRAFAPVQVVTAYAYVSPAATQTYGLQLNGAGGATGKYGAEACTDGIGAGQPAKSGWECDPARWIQDCSLHYECLGLVGGAQVDISVKIGQDYQLRDVDCYDQSVGVLRNEGLGWGTLTGTGCA